MMRKDTLPSRDMMREMLRQMLALKRNYAYRMGLLQFAVMCNVITQDEWSKLSDQCTRKVKYPSIYPKDTADGT